jgi:integrase
VVAAAHRLGPEHRALVALCLFAGLRVSEALSVSAENIRTEAGHTVLEVTSKGGRRDVVPLSAPALRLLSEVLEAHPSGPLLPAVDRFRARRMVAALGREAALGRPLTTHDLRHGAATCAREAGVPLEEVRDLLRHASVTTTQRYDHARKRLDSSAAYGLARAIGEDA